MKYWNKDKEVRRKHWFTVSPPKIHQQQEAKRWCQLQPSNGRFYFHFSNTRWWFEQEADALMFALRWA